jgi:hypothetical protein
VTTTTSSRRTVRRLLGLALAGTLLALTPAVCSAQVGPVPRKMQSSRAPYTSASTRQNAAEAAKAAASPVFKNCDLKDKTASFGQVALGLVGTQECDIPVAAGNPIVSIDIKDNNGADPSPIFKSVKTKVKGDPCNPTPPLDKTKAGTCMIGIGFMPADDHTAVSATMTLTFWDGTPKEISLSGSGGPAAGCLSATHTFLPLTLGFDPGDIYPFALKGMSPDLVVGLYQVFGNPMRKSVVNCFYSTNSLFSYFNQFQSVYNAASGATTLNANLGTLNFANGMQLTVGTNPQVGTPSSNSGTSASTTPAAVIPTLSATAVAQAAQNVQNGGTVVAFDLFPLIARQANPLFYLSTVLREGADLQKFNNTSITSTNPSTHTFVGLQSYLQYNSSNDAANSSGPAGQIFVGGSYGYNLMNHTYSVQNGFGGKINTQLAQVSAGILFSGGVKIAAYRGFGPSQKYIDSTSLAQKTANNFQTWSIAIAYQSSGSGKTK